MHKTVILGASLLLLSAPGAYAHSADRDMKPTQQAAVADPNAIAPPTPIVSKPNMVPAPENVVHDPAAPLGSAANPVVVGGNMIPAPKPLAHYPTCSRTVTDNCMERSAAWHGHAKRRRIA